MYRWVVIGLLRDGVGRSVDGVACAYRERTGVGSDRAELGNELARLVADGVVVVDPGTDRAAATYRLSEAGALAFDAWLTAPGALDDAADDRLTSRLLMLGEASAADAAGLLGRWEAELWERARSLERARAAAAAAPPPAGDVIAVRPALLERLLDHVTADLATLDELRNSWSAWRRPSGSR